MNLNLVLAYSYNDRVAKNQQQRYSLKLRRTDISDVNKMSISQFKIVISKDWILGGKNTALVYFI